MARERSAAQWDNLSKSYRDRLVRKGITRESYTAGINLSTARGHSNASVHRYQRKLVDEYGPRNKAGQPEITPEVLRKARAKHGDPWVTKRLETMKLNNQKFMTGVYPYQGDRTVGKRNKRNQAYATKASITHNPDAPFWWYHGRFS